MDVYKSLRRAAKEARTYASHEAMGLRERQYGYLDVKILLHPGPSMTWGMWEEAITNIAAFLTQYQFLDMDFTIYNDRAALGKGVLTSFE